MPTPNEELEALHPSKGPTLKPNKCLRPDLEAPRPPGQELVLLPLREQTKRLPSGRRSSMGPQSVLQRGMGPLACFFFLKSTQIQYYWRFALHRGGGCRVSGVSPRRLHLSYLSIPVVAVTWGEEREGLCRCRNLPRWTWGWGSIGSSAPAARMQSELRHMHRSRLVHD